MPQHTLTLKCPTGRVSLVPPSQEEDRLVSILRSHPKSRRFLPYAPEHFSVDAARARREAQSEDSSVVPFHIHALNVSGVPTFAGTAGLHHIDSDHLSCEVGIMISPDFHGRRLATDVLYTLMLWAFEERKLHRVVFQTGADNVGMRKFLENVAEAKSEGVMRDCWRGGGKYWDVMSYSVLDWEWANRIKDTLQRNLRISEVPSVGDTSESVWDPQR